MRLVLFLLFCTSCYSPPLPTRPYDEWGRIVRVHTPFSYRCSGILVEDELVLTAYHCAAGNLEVEGRSIESFGQPWPDVDAMLLRVPGLHGQLAIRSQEAVSRESSLVLFGYGRTAGVELDMREAFVTGWWGDQLYTDAPAYLGDSGGPVFLHGELVGIVRAQVLQTKLAVVQLLPSDSRW